VLNACFYIYYNILNLTGQMWSRPPVFAVDRQVVQAADFKEFLKVKCRLMFRDKSEN